MSAGTTTSFLFSLKTNSIIYAFSSLNNTDLEWRNAGRPPNFGPRQTSFNSNSFSISDTDLDNTLNLNNKEYLYLVFGGLKTN